MAYLVVVGSVVVFLLYLVVLRYWTASRASYGFVLIPIVTLVLSAWLDNEPMASTWCWRSPGHGRRLRRSATSRPGSLSGCGCDD